MPRPIEGVVRIVAVGSGKGGVGKTTVAVNLALALAAAGHQVGLFDADVYGPNVPLMLGVRQEKTVRRDLPVARAGRDPYIQPLRRFGLLVASIGLIVGETETVLPDPRLMGMMVVQMLRDVKWGALDVLLVDLPPGSGEPLQTLAQSVQIDGAVIVTTPQDLSLLDAGRSLGLFRKAHIPLLGVVENMSHLVCPHCGEPVEVFLRTDRPWALTDAGLEVLGRIPLSADVSRGIDAGHPLVQAAPDAALAAPFRALAARVAEKLRAD